MRFQKPHRVSGMHTVEGGSMFGNKSIPLFRILIDASTGEQIFPSTDVSNTGDAHQNDAEYGMEAHGSAILAVVEPATITVDAQ